MVEGLIPYVFGVIKRSQRGSRSRNYHRLSSPAGRTASCCFPLLQERFLEQYECLPDRPDRLRASIASPASDRSGKMFKSPAVPAATKSFKMENGYYPREFGRSTSSRTYREVV